MTADLAAPDSLEQFARDEQEQLWDELNLAINQAVNRSWSMAAADFAARIVRCARLVGVTRWEAVPVTLAFGGVYAALVEIGGFTVLFPTDADVDRYVETLRLTGGGPFDPAANRARFAATIEAMRAPREVAWIQGGDE